jgi:hypothetical protein
VRKIALRRSSREQLPALADPKPNPLSEVPVNS